MPPRSFTRVDLCGNQNFWKSKFYGAFVLKRNVRDVVAEWRAVYNETAPASSLLLRHYVETRQPPIDTRRPGRPGKKNADLPHRKKKSAFQGRPAAAPPRPRKNWSPREVAAAIADEVGRNH